MSNSYYNALADELAGRYEALAFDEVHRDIVDLLPDHRAQVLDVGAGSGRDAAALARRGHSVVAVEPADEMRRLARQFHGEAGIRWIDDRLPGLKKVYELGDTYDFILLSAVWMHVPPQQRDRAMRKLTGLLNPGGTLVISTRSVDFTGQRTLYEVRPEKLGGLGDDHGLEVVRRSESEDLLGRDDVDWATVVLRATDDGTEALPVLRNIIVNDAKFSTYKLGLLRSLLRIAAGARGMATMRDDGTVEVPMGLVCLYWLKNYWNPVVDGFQQMHHGQAGFVDDIGELSDMVSLYDLRLGARFGSERAQALHGTLRRVRKSLTSDGPLRHITYLESEQPIFGYHNARTSSSVSAVALTPDYLKGFGTVEIPRHIFHAMERFWVWIEPTVLGEWRGMMQRFGGNEQRDVDDFSRVVAWPGEDRRDTRRVRQLVEQLSPLEGVWRGEAIAGQSRCEVDHCIPYSRWFNNSLWNLLPATPSSNQSKGDRLPSPQLLATREVEQRITGWWRRAYLETDETLDAGGAPIRETFGYEADASLPGTEVTPENPDLGEIYEAVDWQVRRMRRDQQIEVWEG